MCIYGVLVGSSLSVPSLASVLPISFQVIPECVCTLWMCMVWGPVYVACMWRTIAAMSSLSGWCCCDVGC